MCGRGSAAQRSARPPPHLVLQRAQLAAQLALVCPGGVELAHQLPAGRGRREEGDGCGWAGGPGSQPLLPRSGGCAGTGRHQQRLSVPCPSIIIISSTSTSTSAGASASHPLQPRVRLLDLVLRVRQLAQQPGAGARQLLGAARLVRQRLPRVLHLPLQPRHVAAQLVPLVLRRLQLQDKPPAGAAAAGARNTRARQQAPRQAAGGTTPAPCPPAPPPTARAGPAGGAAPPRRPAARAAPRPPPAARPAAPPSRPSAPPARRCPAPGPAFEPAPGGPARRPAGRAQGGAGWAGGLGRAPGRAGCSAKTQGWKRLRARTGGAPSCELPQQSRAGGGGCRCRPPAPSCAPCAPPAAQSCCGAGPSAGC
jgi:hypothetical protein